MSSPLPETSVDPRSERLAILNTDFEDVSSLSVEPSTVSSDAGEHSHSDQERQQILTGEQTNTEASNVQSMGDQDQETDSKDVFYSEYEDPLSPEEQQQQREIELEFRLERQKYWANKLSAKPNRVVDNFLAVYKVLEFLEPDPFVFCRLLLVNKTFYQVFSSDKAWRNLNPYGIDNGIKRHFLTTSTTRDLKYIFLLWNSYSLKSHWEEISTSKNLYLWLGYITHMVPSPDFPTPPVPFTDALQSCAVNINGHAIQWIPDSVKSDELALSAVMSHGCALQWLPLSLRKKRIIVREAVARGCASSCPRHRVMRASPLQFASAEFLADRDIVLDAVRANGAALQYASFALKADKEVVNLAIADDGSAIRYARSKINRSQMFEAVRTYPDALGLKSQYANDEEIVSYAISHNGLALKWASDNLKNDAEIVMAAVRSNGMALEFVPAKFQSDYYLVSTAVEQNGNALQHATQFRRDSALVFRAVETTNPEWMLLDIAYDEKDGKRLFERILRNSRTIRHVKHVLTEDTVATAVRQEPGLYKELPKFTETEEFYTSKRVLQAAIFTDPWIIRYAPSELERDPEILKALETGRV